MNKLSRTLTVIYYIWFAGILIVSSIPDIGSPQESILGFDKYAHFMEYFILALLYILMKKARHDKPAIYNYFLMAVILPVLDELHQLLIRGRECSPLDFAADWAGVTLAFIIYLVISRIIMIKL